MFKNIILILFTYGWMGLMALFFVSYVFSCDGENNVIHQDQAPLEDYAAASICVLNSY